MTTATFSPAHTAFLKVAEDLVDVAHAIVLADEAGDTDAFPALFAQRDELRDRARELHLTLQAEVCSCGDIRGRHVLGLLGIEGCQDCGCERYEAAS